MNKQCQIVQDILPLYVDEACSKASAELVEEHLPQCVDCTKIYESLKKETYENTLREESESVLTHHAKAEKRKTFIVGTCIAGILCIPIIVCLIVNLAVGHALDWFFIVLTSLLVLASLIVVPLMVEKQKVLWTMGSFTLSLLLLLLTCAIYTGGNWFLVVGASVLFGLSVLFLPYIAYKAPLPNFWKKNKGLFLMGTNTILFAGMMICIGCFVKNSTYWEIMTPITSTIVGLIWIVFLICRYLKVSKIIRAGLTSIIIGGFVFVVNNIINMMIGYDLPWPVFHWNVWNTDTVDGNVKWMALIVGAVLGVVLIITGVVRMIVEKRNKRMEKTQ